MALADVDGDGDLDLYVGNYKRVALRDSLPPQQLAWEKMVKQVGDSYTIIPEFSDHYTVEIRGNQVVRQEVGEADRFYLNDGAGRFTPVSFTDGAFLDEDGHPLSEEPKDWALVVRFQDINGDGLPDLYVCNDFESPDHFWLGDGTGRFRAAPRMALRKTSQSTMSVAFSDIDRDGRMDFFLADMLSRDYARRQMQRNTQAPVPTGIGEIDNRPQEMQNTLFLSRGDGAFTEVAHLAGVEASEWTWSSVFLDVDLDGYEDLLLTTGHSFDVQNLDAQERERMSMTRVRNFDEFRRLILEFPNLPLRNIAFRNRGGSRSGLAQAPAFEHVPDGWGLGSEADVSHGLALGDFDRDGDLDIVINRLNDTAALFRNQASAPRLAVRLRGRAPTPRASVRRSA